MRINSFVAKGVHDYLDFNIDFFSDITFLIGINGSGKTSVLKLILGLTSPSYHYLSQIDYDYCEVICSSNENERDIVIRSDQNKKEGTFAIKLIHKNKTTTSEVIKRVIRSEDLHYDVDEYNMIEQRHKEYFDSIPVTGKIREIITPKFLGLDRRIYEGYTHEFRFKNRRQYLNKFKRKFSEGYPELSSIDIGLEEVQILIYDFIRRIPQQQFAISDDFKEKLFRESFNFIDRNSVSIIPSTSEIIERKEKVLRAIEDLGIKFVNFSINNFFEQIENIATEYEALKGIKEDNEITEKNIELFGRWYLNGNQLKRIDDIIAYSQDYQKRVALLRAPLKKLEDLTSNFLIEGNKKLITAADGEMKIELKNGKYTTVFDLSSGEKQMIIMIAHLIFEEAQKNSGIFIIDEPELSLHIAWQEIFVQSIMEASPKTQFILATHSPSIVAKNDFRERCQDLNKLNS